MLLLSDKSMVFDHADPYAVSGYVNQHVGHHCIQLPSKGGVAASLSHRKFASLDLCRISYGGSARVTSEALETIYHLQILLKGHCLWRQHHDEHFLAPGELLLINPDDPVDLTYSDDCEKFIVKLPVSLLQAACEEQRWRIPEQGIHFTRNLYSLQELESLTRLLGLVCLEAEADDNALQTQEHYSRIIASKLLTQLGSNLCRELPLPQAAPFEHLIEYIENNLKQDISAEHLAACAQISLRSLYALFERHSGSTPKQYVRERKLARIHSCLSDPSCHVRSVTEIALDYGFTHLGRFSESYKNSFGELPSDTLRRRG
ncbi:AraC family transcriptional regulator [Pseudomonas benzenivorans]|uniref:AraC family transcriptional regulator n=1 Tax=Pseudomonas benzenivorans TaxID=556533 RepID=A0ABY5H789_9PSED|nr:AraC family transcriptional regulator [Pseudomonas benzenivorans]UTW08125.1 AraC family transcriptional regulator [Pseudomonas benzenivorans]